MLGVGRVDSSSLVSSTSQKGGRIGVHSARSHRGSSRVHERHRSAAYSALGAEGALASDVPFIRVLSTSTNEPWAGRLCALSLLSNRRAARSGACVAALALAPLTRRTREDEALSSLRRVRACAFARAHRLRPSVRDLRRLPQRRAAASLFSRLMIGALRCRRSAREQSSASERAELNASSHARDSTRCAQRLDCSRASGGVARSERALLRPPADEALLRRRRPPLPPLPRLGVGLACREKCTRRRRMRAAPASAPSLFSPRAAAAGHA